MLMKYLSMKPRAKNTTSSEWNPNRVMLITVKGHSKEGQVHQDMRESAKMLKMTFSMATSSPRKTFTTSSRVLLNSKEKRRGSNREADTRHKVKMTFSEPLNILNTQIKKQKIKIPTLEMKIHIKGLNRNKSHKIILADLGHLITTKNGAIPLNKQKKMMKISKENMRNG